MRENGVFLAPTDRLNDVDRTSAFWANGVSDGKVLFGWIDADYIPRSPEAAVCVFLGNDERCPMLERIADELLPATKVIALEELEFTHRLGSGWGTTLFYVPIIITNAILHIGSFDPAKLSMKTGRLIDGECEFKEVPYVQFRKALRPAGRPYFFASFDLTRFAISSCSIFGRRRPKNVAELDRPWFDRKMQHRCALTR
jgi:hypothetical protein